ncbi:ABC transporter substrate-binding protein [Gordonia sp. X0973]|uniref:ABC transporter substrate-binding protein n=1 Tax=Gordonia sp. X0973 TaxID=2742602 RepID=UPI000F51CF32|nr:ABC transporter substrate-binding protein [Gordonia sp. X0973]QKT07260.1 ABC transporter substrate-binding protein [Gordonia sp. X0973]
MMRPKAIGVLAAAALLAVPVLAGCGADQNRPLYYRTDARLSTYNAASAKGNSDGVLMAFARVQGGFNAMGPQGQTMSDRDIGEVAQQPGPVLTLRYTFSAKAVFSDGTKLSCDDLLLSWAAQSGRFKGFDAATTAGYRDIDRVDCAAGEPSATVYFLKGRDYRDWRSLFGAGTLLPAHIVAQDAGVPSVVDPIRKRDPAVLAAIAKSWNTGFDLPTGRLDPKRFVSSGPYRADSFDPKTGLRLVRNEAWWGEPAALASIVVFGRNTDTAARAAAGGFEVTDTTAGIEPPSEKGGNPESPKIAPSAGALSTEQLVLASRGPLGPPPARQAFGACVPRDQLARSFGYGSQPWNLHVYPPAGDLADPINGQFGQRFARADILRSRDQLKQRPPGPNGEPAPPLRVRIGYLGPDNRHQQMVAAIADSCRRAGIDVVDAGSPTVSVGDLRAGKLDVLLLNSGASFAASGAAEAVRDSYSLYGGDPLNIGDFNDPAATEAVAKFAVAEVAGDQLALSRTMEAAAWRGLSALPLFATPREQVWSEKLTGVISGRGRVGTGWNMDRWMRK